MDWKRVPLGTVIGVAREEIDPTGVARILAAPDDHRDARRRSRVTGAARVTRRKNRRETRVADAGEVEVGASAGDPHPLVARHVMRVVSDTVAPGDSLARAARLMELLGMRELPVVDGRALVGILTRTDLEPYRGHLEWTTTRSAMTPDPVTVLPDAPIREVVDVLLVRGFNSVPVSAGGELLGMIRRTDALRAFVPNQ
jgi:CBS domain-containing protein